MNNTFDPKKYFQNLSKGGAPRLYLPTEARIMWFRQVHPLGSILVHADATTGLVYATVHVDGVEIASDIATVRDGKGLTWAGRELEKAATAAIGRALKNAGFGTMAAMAFTGMEGQAEDEDGELDYLADSPVEAKSTTKPAATPAKRTNPYQAAQQTPASNDEQVINQSGWELNTQTEGVLIMQVKNAVVAHPAEVANTVKKMRNESAFDNCPTFADAVALAIERVNSHQAA